MATLTEEQKKELQDHWANDMPLLVAHLLGGRYGFEDNYPDSLEQKVSCAIIVAKEITRQLLQELETL
jgi:hypothetical protein